MHQQSFIWTSTVLTIRTHQLLVCSWKFILSNHFSRSMSLYHLVMTWDVSSWNSMSSSSFRLIPHQPLLIYILRSIRNMLFLSFCVAYLSLHKCFPSHILCMQHRLFFSTKYDILVIVGHYYFCHQNIKFTLTTIKTIFSWFTYFSWRVIVLFVRNCWWILLFYVMSNILSLSWIWNTQAVSQKKLQYCFLMPGILCLVNTDSCGWVFLIANPPFSMSFHT